MNFCFNIVYIYNIAVEFSQCRRSNIKRFQWIFYRRKTSLENIGSNKFFQYRYKELSQL